MKRTHKKIIRTSISERLLGLSVLVPLLLLGACSRTWIEKDHGAFQPGDEKELLKQAKLAFLQKGSISIDEAIVRLATEPRDAETGIDPEPSEDISSLSGWTGGGAAVVVDLSVMPAECTQMKNPDACWGDKIRNARGCVACHSVDGTEMQPAPNWKGIFGHEVTLDNGSLVKVDEAYIKNSIKDPWSQLVQGYGRSMPPQTLSDTEINAVIAYIKSIGNEEH